MMAGGMLAAVDPGREKCGFAVLDAGGAVLFQQVIETLKLEHEIDGHGEAGVLAGASAAWLEEASACFNARATRACR